MTPIEYLKLQAKNLLKDFKTQTFSFDPKLRRNVYEYDPKFFKIDMLIDDFNINEEKFQLGNAQHVIAKLCGLEKWQDLSNASPAKIELSVLLFTNMDTLEIRDWNQYVLDIETSNNIELDDEFKVQIFKEGFLDWQKNIHYDDYRLSKDEDTDIEWEHDEPASIVATAKISSLPINEGHRKEFIEAANRSFERVFERIEPENPELTRSLWDAERYIEEEILTPERLPIDLDYALHIVDAFMVGYLIQLAVQVDNQGSTLN